MASLAPAEHDDAPAPFGHHPGLDGLRALAVAAVLLYHARFEVAAGGFLGVSTFFTLSGFLITSLLLREHARGGRIDLRGFWSRRVRRLLPAALVTQAVVVAMAFGGVWDTEQLRDLRGDIPAALLQVVNWHFIAADRTYGDRFTAPSPLEHFWSLGVEEQFYLVFPVLVLAVLTVGRRRRGLLVGVLVAAIAVSASVNAWLASASVDRAYFGTDTRLAELAVGALLAVAMLRRVELAGAARGAVLAVAVAGLGVSLWLWHVATVSSAWLYPGGLLLSAAASAGLVAGAVQPGPLRRVLSLPPLRWLGRVSYGVYLLHWPIYGWLTPARTGWAPVPLLLLRLAVTFLAAELMFRWIEHPIRGRRLLPTRRSLVSLPAAAVAVLVGALVVTADLPAPERLLVASRQGDAAPTTTVVRPPRVLVVGDELAASLGPGLGSLGAARVESKTVASPSCGLAVGGYVRLPDGTVERDTDRCRGAHAAWTAAEQELRPDVVVVWAGVRDLADRRLSIQTPWVGPGDDALADFYRTEVLALAERLSAGGAHVVWLDLPYLRSTNVPPPVVAGPAPGEGGDPATEALQLLGAYAGVPPAGFAENEDGRVDVVNALLAEAVGDAPRQRVLPVAGWLAGRPGGTFDPAVRAGGVGLTAAGAEQAAAWLVDQVQDLRRAPAAVAGQPEEAATVPLPAAPPEAPRRVAAAGETPRAMVVGDSVAFGHALGLSEWASRSRELSVTNHAQFGCPIARGGTHRFLGEVDEFPDRCDWATRFGSLLAGEDPHVVVLSTGIWEIVDRILPGDRRWRHIGDPVVDRYLQAELLTAIDALGSRGALVAVVDYPHIEAGRNQGFVGLPESDPARVDRLNALLAETVALRPGVARLVPFQRWLAEQPGGELDDLKRTDGIHFRDEYVPAIGAWLGPQLATWARGG